MRESVRHCTLQLLAGISERHCLQLKAVTWFLRWVRRNQVTASSPFPILRPDAPLKATRWAPPHFTRTAAVIAGKNSAESFLRPTSTGSSRPHWKSTRLPASSGPLPPPWLPLRISRIAVHGGGPCGHPRLRRPPGGLPHDRGGRPPQCLTDSETPTESEWLNTTRVSTPAAYRPHPRRSSDNTAW
jgi:hypothetical protein